jgi:ribonucleotide reductase beta subunit family protein with ferritin-like domain
MPGTSLVTKTAEDLSISELICLLKEKCRAKTMSERYTLFPISDDESYKFWKTHEAAIWTCVEMDFSRDKQDYDSLDEKRKRIVDYINAFFSATDGQIVDNILLRFLLEAETLEEQAFYIQQAQMELVHSETYSLILNTLVRDPEERNKLLKASDSLECVLKKNLWIEEGMNSNSSISKRRLLFACAEGIFFTSSFLFIFWFRSSGKFQNMIFANEQISKDENLHRDFGIYRYLRDGKLSDEEASSIVSEAVDLECAFIDELLPEAIDDLTPEDAKNYVKVLADLLLLACEHPPIYQIDKSTLPSWMNDIAMSQKGNFYEVRIGSYKSASLKKAIDWKGRIEGTTKEKEEAYSCPSCVDF